MSVQKTLEVLRMRKLMGRDELVAEDYDVSDEFLDLSESEWADLPKEMRAIVEDKKHVLTYSYGDSSFKLKPIKVNNDDEDVPDLTKPSDYEKDGGDATKANKKMTNNDKMNTKLDEEEVVEESEAIEESIGVSPDRKEHAKDILNKKGTNWDLEPEKDPEQLDFEAKTKEQKEKEAREKKADEILSKSKLSSATFSESYQNRQEFESDEDADTYFGHKHPRETKVALPSEVKKAMAENIKRIKDYMNDNEGKEFKDGEKAIDAMERIESELSSGDYEGFLNAQIFFHTLMGPIVDFFPSELVTFLSTGHQNQDGDSGYNKEVEPFETKLSESYMFSREERFNQFFIDEILPEIVKQYGFDDKPAIDQAYNDTLDSYERDGMLPADSKNWTLPQEVTDNPSNYITESTRIIVEYGSNSFDESNTAIETWFERDRQYVGLYPVDDEGKPDTNQKAIVEWWDEDVSQAVEDGFLDPRDWHGSALDYAKHLGLIKESRKFSIREAMKNKKSKTKTANPCWPGYKQVGMKKGIKGKKEVPNCVPKDGTDDS